MTTSPTQWMPVTSPPPALRNGRATAGFWLGVLGLVIGLVPVLGFAVTVPALLLSRAGKRLFRPAPAPVVVPQAAPTGEPAPATQAARPFVDAPDTHVNRPYVPAPKAAAGSSGGGAYFANCSAARAAGAAPLHAGDPGYRGALDRDGDGIACE